MANPEAHDPVLADLGARIREALTAGGLPDGDPDFERPKQADHGDWATTLPLRLAKVAGRPPRAIAESLVEHLVLPEAVEAVEIAGPGFVNFRFGHSYYESRVREVLATEHFGRAEPATDGEFINVEFVSANPTGPLHAGNGRWAAAGDALAEILAADGNRVEREYYVNDAGEQLRIFGESVLRRAIGEDLGEEHYKGEYIQGLADELVAAHGLDHFAGDRDARVDQVARDAVDLQLDHIRATLLGLGVAFDTWFSEAGLHASGAIEKVIAKLREAGHIYEDEGAVFLRTTTYGDDKDRVVIRSDGRPTYFAADCAYLEDKHARGYDRMIYILGADHHGYVGRMQAMARCLGITEDELEIRIGQNVNLLRGGEPAKMSKRAGDFVTLDEVVEEVGVDVARYVYLRQSLDTSIDFDLDVVVQQSMENPVYYVQYAHARVASLVRNADEQDFVAGDAADADLSLLTAPAELELLKKMIELPDVVTLAAELRAVQRVARYAEDLAASFHRFYAECRVLGEEEDIARARYWLAVAAKRVLGNTLALLRVSAPERM